MRYRGAANFRAPFAFWGLMRGPPRGEKTIFISDTS